jgi:hypothetical protein
LGTFNTFEYTDGDSSLLWARSKILRSASDLIFPGTRSAEGEDECPVGFERVDIVVAPPPRRNTPAVKLFDSFAKNSIRDNCGRINFYKIFRAGECSYHDAGRNRKDAF